MKSTLTIISLLLMSHLFAQENFIIKLLDAYSYTRIEMTGIKILHLKNYQIDSLNHLIRLDKAKKQNFTLTIDNYRTTEVEVNFKDSEQDTLEIHLIPVDSILHKRFHELYGVKTESDTLIFDTITQLDKHLNMYLNYLSVLQNSCFNGFCNYSNTYRYSIEFTAEKGIYSISSISKFQPLSSSCAELDEALDQLKINFPKFRIAQNEEAIRKSLVIGPY